MDQKCIFEPDPFWNGLASFHFKGLSQMHKNLNQPFSDDLGDDLEWYKNTRYRIEYNPSTN